MTIDVVCSSIDSEELILGLGGRIVVLEDALEKAKGLICPHCAAKVPISFHRDEANYSERFHTSSEGKNLCSASFIQQVLPSLPGEQLHLL